MASELPLKTNYEVVGKIDAFYTGGAIQLSPDGKSWFCMCGDTINKIDVASGKKIDSFKDDEDDITTFAVSPDNQLLVVASKNLLMHQFELGAEEQKVSRRWKAIHKTPVLEMVFDQTSTLLASGSSDSTIKVYDVTKQYYTHNFKGSQGVISVLEYHPDPDKLVLFSSSDDGKIRMWDLNTSKCLSVLEGHFSPATALIFSKDHSILVSSGRDNVMIMWDLANRKQLRTVPVFECIESMINIPPGAVIVDHPEGEEIEYFATAGEKGVIRLWNMATGRSVYPPKNTKKIKEGEEKAPTLLHIGCIAESNSLYTVTYDHNILLYDLSSMKRRKQFIGYYDEILDMRFYGPEEESIVIATNSDQIKVIHRETQSSELLSGHQGTVLGLDVSFDGKYIASCSKDNSIRIWKQDLETKEFRCVATGNGHTHAIDAISWPKTSTNFLISGSQDMTLKYWKLPDMFEEDAAVQLTAKWTQKAHDKDINAVTVAPNDKIVASASQDKTIKLWKSKKGTLLGTMRGHKRGIWCAVFSPVDRCLATGSSDSTIKLWALADYTCIKSFEGHTNSVLKVAFCSRGMQLLSSGSDGLIKLWTISTNECVKTLDQHDDKVWALTTTKAADVMVTGGGDSLINIWKDVTEEEKLKEREEQEGLILREQELSNLLQQKKFVKAIGLAITLDQPFRVLNIFKDMLDGSEGKEQIKKALLRLRDDQLNSLLGFMCDWNTNAKHSFASQTVCSLILQVKSPEELSEFPNIKETIEALLPYTERHFQRMNRLLQQSMFVDYTWQSMKLSTPRIITADHLKSDPFSTETSKKDIDSIVESIPPQTVDVYMLPEAEQQSLSPVHDDTIPYHDASLNVDATDDDEVEIVATNDEVEQTTHMIVEDSHTEDEQDIHLQEVHNVQTGVKGKSKDENVVNTVSVVSDEPEIQVIPQSRGDEVDFNISINIDSPCRSNEKHAASVPSDVVDIIDNTSNDTIEADSPMVEVQVNEEIINVEENDSGKPSQSLISSNTNSPDDDIKVTFEVKGIEGIEVTKCVQGIEGIEVTKCVQPSPRKSKQNVDEEVQMTMCVSPKRSKSTDETLQGGKSEVITVEEEKPSIQLKTKTPGRRKSRKLK